MQLYNPYLFLTWYQPPTGPSIAGLGEMGLAAVLKSVHKNHIDRREQRDDFISLLLLFLCQVNRWGFGERAPMYCLLLSSVMHQGV